MAKAVVLDKTRLVARRIETADYPIAKIIQGRRFAEINETIPFRVRFTTITVPGYSSSNVPGIGIQVIGFSNYIL